MKRFTLISAFWISLISLISAQSAVELKEPVNTLTGVSVLPYFNWTDESQTSYTIEVNDTSGNYTHAATITVTGANADTFYQTTEFDDGFPLENGKWYYWRVKFTVGSTTYTSVEDTFKTVEKLMPVLDSPTDGDTVNTLKPTMNWHFNTIASGAFSKLEYSKVRTGENLSSPLAINNLSNINYTFDSTNALDPATKYYWRIKAYTKDTVLADLSPIDSFYTGGFVVVPTPSWPDNHTTTYTSSQTLFWYVNSYNSAYTYEVELEQGAVDSTAFSGSPDSAATSNTFFKYNGLLPGTSYTWRVRTKTSYAASAWSDTASFVTAGAGTALQPKLSYPVDSAVVYTTSPTLNWYVEGDGTGLTYDVEYRSMGSSGAFTTAATGLSDSYFKLTGLDVGASYEWHVRSKNSSGTPSAYSDLDTFAVFGSAGFVPKLGSPIDTVELFTLQPTFTWYLNSSYFGVQSYEIIVKEGMTYSGTTVIDTTTSINLYFTSLAKKLSYNKSYSWKVIVTDSNGNTATSELGIFKITDPTGTVVPVPSYPIDGTTVYTTKPRLTWYVNGISTAVTDWKVRYSITQNFTNDPQYTTTVDIPADSGMAYVIDTAQAGAMYFWKVKAKAAGSWGSWSVTESFIVQSGIQPVVPLIGGPDDVIITTTAPVMSWYLPIAPKTDLSYDLQYSTNEDMSGSVVVNDLSRPKFESTGLMAGETYYWRVVSKDDKGGKSLFSDKGQFEVASSVTGIEDEIIPDEFTVYQNYPNPFNPSTSIIFSLSKAEYVSIKIFNMLGQEIRTLLAEEMTAGRHSVVWNGKDKSGGNVTTGAYFYRAQAGDKVTVRKMLLLK